MAWCKLLTATATQSSQLNTDAPWHGLCLLTASCEDAVDDKLKVSQKWGRQGMQDPLTSSNASQSPQPHLVIIPSLVIRFDNQD